jgi:hypothetical protein
MSWPSPPGPWGVPVTPQEDEAWQELADRIADRVADRLAVAPDDRPLLTVKGIAERLSISDRSARGLVNGEDGKPPKLRSVLVGPGEGARRVIPADLDAFVETQRQTT